MHMLFGLQLRQSVYAFVFVIQNFIYPQTPQSTSDGCPTWEIRHEEHCSSRVRPDRLQ